MNRLLAISSLFAQGRQADFSVCRCGDRIVRWAALHADVAAQAAKLLQRPESRWLLTEDNPYTFLVLLLAMLHADKRAVIPPDTRPGTLRRLGSAYDAIAAYSNLSAGASAPLGQIDASKATIDFYTSGSTGEPKQVSKTLVQIEMEIAVLEQCWGATLAGASIVATAPHRHIYGLMFRLLWPLAAGRLFDTLTSDNPGVLLQRAALLKPAALVSSPAQLTRLPELIDLTALAPSLCLIFSSGGPLPLATAQALRGALGRAPVEILGSTETGAIAWRSQESQESQGAWSPLPGISLSCAKDGALVVTSPFVADGAPWRTEDAADMLGDGRFLLRGRLDRIVKIEEKRLSLPDMEARLCAHPWVSAAAVLSLSGTRRQGIAAVVVLNQSGQQQLAETERSAVGLELKRHLSDYFDRVLLPRRWRFPDYLPFDERGKLPQANLATLFDAEEDVRTPA